MTNVSLQLITLAMIVTFCSAAPVPSTNCDGNGGQPGLNSTIILRQLRNGLEVLSKAHEGKLLATIRYDADVPANATRFNSSDFRNSLQITCSLKSAKDNLWALDAKTGEEAEDDIRLLRYITGGLAEESCKWTKRVYQQLHPTSTVHLQCTWDEINRMCDQYNALVKAETHIERIELYEPALSTGVNATSWVTTNLPSPENSSPQVRRLINYAIRA